jgi:hypothetical protein
LGAKVHELDRQERLHARLALNYDSIVIDYLQECNHLGVGHCWYVMTQTPELGINDDEYIDNE